MRVRWRNRRHTDVQRHGQRLLDVRRLLGRWLQRKQPEGNLSERDDVCVGIVLPECAGVWNRRGRDVLRFGV